MSYDKGQISALSCLFSARIFHDLGRHGRSAIFPRLVQQANISGTAPPGCTVGDVFDEAFSLLNESGVRDEYVFRSAIAQKILLGRHSLNTATILNEFRAGCCKADVVILNGTSTAYEIKSERDTLSRLPNQLSNYRRVFARVYVVVGASHLSEVRCSIPGDVGVLLLTDRFTFRMLREARDLPEATSPLMILEVLRTHEAVSVLSALNLDIPNVPNTQMRAALKEIFVDLDPVEVHQQMVKELKRSRSQATLTQFVRALPASVRAAALAVKPDMRSQDRIIEAVQTPLTEALAWK